MDKKKRTNNDQLPQYPGMQLIVIEDSNLSEEIDLSYDEVISSLNEAAQHLEENHVSIDEIPLNLTISKTIH